MYGVWIIFGLAVIAVIAGILLTWSNISTVRDRYRSFRGQQVAKFLICGGAFVATICMFLLASLDVGLGIIVAFVLSVISLWIVPSIHDEHTYYSNDS